MKLTPEQIQQMVDAVSEDLRKETIKQLREAMRWEVENAAASTIRDAISSALKTELIPEIVAEIVREKHTIAKTAVEAASAIGQKVSEALLAQVTKALTSETVVRSILEKVTRGY